MFLNERCARASGVVSALESFQRVSVSSWELASNIVFVGNETTLKPMPLPALRTLGQGLAPARVGCDSSPTLTLPIDL